MLVQSVALTFENSVALTFENFVRLSLSLSLLSLSLSLSLTHTGGVELGTGGNVCGSVSEDLLPESGHVLVWGEAQAEKGYGGGGGGHGARVQSKYPVG